MEWSGQSEHLDPAKTSLLASSFLAELIIDCGQLLLLADLSLSTRCLVNQKGELGLAVLVGAVYLLECNHALEHELEEYSLLLFLNEAGNDDFLRPVVVHVAYQGVVNSHAPRAEMILSDAVGDVA